MVTSVVKKSGTGYSFGVWTVQEHIPRAKLHSETKAVEKDDAFVVAGSASSGVVSQGIKVSIAPATVSKKLAIRKLNSEVEGWTARSNTMVGKFR